MKYRLLGGTGLRVSEYTLGTLSFGSDGNTDEAECIRIVHTALDRGINFIDTADTYSQGEAEQIVGRAIAGRRDKIVLATKFRLPAGDGQNEQGGSRYWIMTQVENSLRRLGTDHIDLYQMHRPDLQTDLDETLEALTNLVTQGKVRYLGCSTFPSWYLAETQAVSRLRQLSRFVNESSPYSMFVRVAERETLPAVQYYRMGFTAWSPLNGGWLTGKYRTDAAPPPGSRAERVKGQWGEHYPILQSRFDMQRSGNRRKLALLADLEALSQDASLRLMHLAQAFPLSHPAVTSVIVGPRKLSQYEDMQTGFDTRLDSATLDRIDALVAPGDLIEEADRGYVSPWMTPEARREHGGRVSVRRRAASAGMDGV
jgi:aryl-alcohol dehydrogenase-like predicted oxidoreductase